MNTEKLSKEVGRFREIVIEFTFLVRTMFFLLFGYLIDTQAVLDLKSLMIAGSIVGTILLIRLVYLSISKIPILPLLFIAPRGLITILLFLSIPTATTLPFINRPLMIQVILLSTLVMMFGLMFHKKNEVEIEVEVEVEDTDENIH